MYIPLTLQQVKDHLRTDPTSTVEDALLADYLLAAVAVFEQQSKRHFTDPAAPLPIAPAVADPANLVIPGEQEVGKTWLRFYLGHMYENRQSVAVSLHTLEVPDTCQLLMKILRAPTL